MHRHMARNTSWDSHCIASLNILLCDLLMPEGVFLQGFPGKIVSEAMQPSLKLQSKVLQDEQVRRVYDEAQTPLQRVLTSGVLSEEQHRDLSTWVQQIDPLVLSEHLDALRYALLCVAHVSPAVAASGLAWQPRCFSLAVCASGTRPMPEEGHAESPTAEPSSSQEGVSDADWCVGQDQPLPTIADEAARKAVGEGEKNLMTVEQAMTAYLQEMRACGRSPKTLEWHHTSLRALRHYLWKQYQLTDVRHLSRDCLRTWVADLHFVPSARSGVTRTVSTVSAYARSARAFCNWLVQQGYVSESPFPYNVIPDIPQGPFGLVEPEIFARLLRACQLQGAPGGHHAALTVRNRAILWLLWETGMQVSDLCGLRLADIDRAKGTVSVQGKRGHLRAFSLSSEGMHVLCAYLDQARLTPAWKLAMPEMQDRLFLTERRRPLIKSNLTGLFLRLSQRAGFSETPICPSMLRDTYAVRFLQAGGDMLALQEQLGVANSASVRRYQRFCDEQRRAEAGAQAIPKEQAKPPRSAKRSKSKRRKARGRW